MGLTFLLIPLALGFCFMNFLLINTKLPNQLFFKLSISLPIGFGIISIILFWAHLTNGKWAPLVTERIAILIATTFIILWTVISIRKFSIKAQNRNESSLWKRLKQTVTSPFPTQSNLKLLCIAVTLILFALNVYDYIRYFLTNSVSETFLYGGWDARYFWNLKASFFVREPEKWKRMFDPVLSWSHTDYPLLLPGSVAWGWNWLHNESAAVPIFIEFCFFISIICLVIWYFISFSSVWTALLAASVLLGIENLRFWSMTQYADIPLSFFMTTSSIMLICAHRTKETTVLFLAGLCAGFAAWTKNEGIPFVFWLGIGIIFLMLGKHSAFQNRKKEALFRFGLGLVIPLTTTFVLKIFLDHSGNEFATSGQTAQQLVSKIFNPATLLTLGKAYFVFTTNFHQWSGLWILFVLAFLIHLWVRLRQEVFILVFLIFAIELTYVPIILTSPYGLLVQVQTSLSRLLLHTSILALIYSFEIITSLVSPLPSTQSNSL